MSWGIFMTGFTLFGMLALVVASVYTDDAGEAAEVHTSPPESSDDGESYKKAA